MSHVGSQKDEFSRVPASVIYDARLSPLDVRVFAALACGVWQGNVVVADQSEIARLISCSRRQVARSVANLKHSGHMTQAKTKLGRLVAYALTSPIFNGNTARIKIERHGGRRAI